VESKKIALITGITGQDGSYLSELLLDRGYIVHGVKRRSSSLNTQRLDHLYEDPHDENIRLHLHYGDMTDSTNIIRLISQIRPNEIYNLAAQSHVHVSFETAEYTANADGLGALRILEAIRLLGMEDICRFYQASTSEMFGLVENEDSLNEQSSFHPRSPYGVAKLYAHWITVNYREAYGIFASTGILFNHESPRRGETFVTRKIVRAAVNIKLGKQQTLFLGNLNAIRDWGHAKDYVEGMWKILQHSKPSDFVLATGSTCSVRDFVEKVFNKLELPLIWSGEGEKEVAMDQNGRIVVRVDNKYYRPSEVPFLLGDASKAKNELGWSPRYSLDDLVDEMIRYELADFKDK